MVKGFGAYFTDFGSAAFQYGRNLILCRVLVGNPYVGDLKGIQSGYQSKIDSPDPYGYSNYILIDDSAQILPVFQLVLKYDNTFLTRTKSVRVRTSLVQPFKGAGIVLGWRMYVVRKLSRGYEQGSEDYICLCDFLFAWKSVYIYVHLFVHNLVPSPTILSTAFQLDVNQLNFNLSILYYIPTWLGDCARDSDQAVVDKFSLTSLKFDGENLAQMRVTLNDTESIAKIKVVLIFTVCIFFEQGHTIISLKG